MTLVRMRNGRRLDLERAVQVLRDFVHDVDGMGGIRTDEDGRIEGLIEETDTRMWANLAITAKAAADLLNAAGMPIELATTHDDEEPE